MLRRKHFKEIARILRIYKLHYPDMPIRAMANDFTEMCKEDNPSFDKSKFMKESGFYDEL